MSSVAVIDIGSNSIKVLVATRGAAGKVAPLRTRTIDARISAGIGGPVPRLSANGMARGVEAIRSLLEDAAALGATATLLVATSAVRDAENRADFQQQVKSGTGHDIRILTGDEEARFIGRGLSADPALGHLKDFYVFDLGGGSMECLSFRNRIMEHALSLPLGCVRLTEKFLPDPTQPFPAATATAIAAHTRALLADSGFTFSLPESAVAVGTGGTVTSVRAILGARDNRSLDATSPVVTLAQIRDLLATLSAMPLAARKTVPGLPAARADVFPAALATLIALAEVGGLTLFQNSVYNLRYGLADQALPP